MKVWAAVTVMCGLLALLGGVAAEEAPKPDGVFYGSAKGHVASVAVKVEVKDGAIIMVVVERHRESRTFKAETKIPKRIIEKQSTNVDVVTKATVISKAIMKAVEDALASASRRPADGLPDGTYSGTAKGHRGPVEVEFDVKAGRFTRIEAGKHRENRPRTALQDIPRRMLQQQKTNVDVVTRATVTSRAVTKAVEAAIEEERAKLKNRSETP
jgi:uncharacterized protein with FMN-binding domain